MNLFVEYRPREPGAEPTPPLEGVTIRTAVAGDRAAIAAIKHEREGGDLDLLHERLNDELAPPQRVGENVVFVAEGGGRVVAFARARYLTPPPDAPENVIPRGWYLMGTIVAPTFRRSGVGRALTQTRMDWLRERCVQVHTFVNVQNRASLDLLGQFGFQEVTRDFTAPGVTFQGGEGVLLRAHLAPPRPA